MASATKSKKKNGVSKARKKELREEAKAFKEKQETDSDAQAATSSNAVPEQRPQAFAQVDDSKESKQFRLKRERGDLEPMPKSAHDRAASNAQLEKAEEQETKLGPETLREGARVRITEGDYEGSEGAIIEVEYDGFEEAQKAKSGDPSVARFARAASYMVRTRGGAHALVNVKPDEVESVTQLAGTNTQGA